MSAQARQQALEALVEAHARELHLPTVRQRFRALASEAVRAQQTPLAYLAALLEVEVHERAGLRSRATVRSRMSPLIWASTRRRCGSGCARPRPTKA